MAHVRQEEQEQAQREQERHEQEQQALGRPGIGAPVIDLESRRRDRNRRQATASAEALGEPPGWLLRSPAYRVVENLAPWAGITDGGSFAALLDDPIDAHLILTTFPPHALARSFCGGPTLEQVGLGITRQPRRIKARVWVGGYGTQDEGITVAAVYVRFKGIPSDADIRAAQHPTLWAWLVDRLGHDRDKPRWPEPDEITRDSTDVGEPGIWWRLRWGPSRTPYARQAGVTPLLAPGAEPRKGPTTPEPPAGIGSLPRRRTKAIPEPDSRTRGQQGRSPGASSIPPAGS